MENGGGTAKNVVKKYFLGNKNKKYYFLRVGNTRKMIRVQYELSIVTGVQMKIKTKLPNFSKNSLFL